MGPLPLAFVSCTPAPLPLCFDFLSSFSLTTTLRCTSPAGVCTQNQWCEEKWGDQLRILRRYRFVSRILLSCKNEPSIERLAARKFWCSERHHALPHVLACHHTIPIEDLHQHFRSLVSNVADTKKGIFVSGERRNSSNNKNETSRKLTIPFFHST